jgi:hypothetical protein
VFFLRPQNRSALLSIAKVKQRNVPKGTSGENKATELNSQVFHGLAKIKVPEELGEIKIAKSNWHSLVDEAMEFKQSAFFKTEGGVGLFKTCPNSCMEKECGHLI